MSKIILMQFNRPNKNVNNMTFTVSNYYEKVLLCMKLNRIEILLII